jgi:hypothetical protein
MFDLELAFFSKFSQYFSWWIYLFICFQLLVFRLWLRCGLISSLFHDEFFFKKKFDRWLLDCEQGVDWLQQNWHFPWWIFFKFFFSIVGC